MHKASHGHSYVKVRTAIHIYYRDSQTYDIIHCIPISGSLYQGKSSKQGVGRVGEVAHRRIRGAGAELI